MIILILIILALSYIFLIFPKYKQNGLINPPPGPKGLPFIGNMHQYDFKAPHVYLAKLAKTYGPIVSLRFGCANVIVVQSAELAKEVLQTQDLNFCSRPRMAALQKLSYNGLDIAFSEYNEYYKEVKKFSVVHLLSSIRVRSFAHIHQDEISRLINEIRSLSSNSKIVNLTNLASDYGHRYVCRVAFGSSNDKDDEETMSKFRGLFKEIVEILLDFAYSDYFPSLGWLDKLSGKSARLEKLFRDLDAFYENIISEHLHPNHHNNIDRHKDVIDVLLRIKKERSFAYDLTLDRIKAILMNIFVAGVDTSSVSIIWAMTELIKSPSAMKKVQDELRNQIKKPSGYIIEDDLKNLEYFNAVVKESYRLHPPGPLMLPHQANRESKINGYDIVPKTVVFVNVWAIGRDPKSWINPEKFMPERFLGSSIDFKGNDFEFIPFGAGRRKCPGLYLGDSIVKLALANLLYSFDWKLPVGVTEEDVDMDILPGIVTHKKNSLCLTAKEFSYDIS